MFSVTFDINRPPRISFGDDVSGKYCEFEEICFPYTAGDPDGIGTTNISLVSGPGILDPANSRVCFTPTSTGTYTFVICIEDECGLRDCDTVRAYVDKNHRPKACAGDDKTYFKCDTVTQICWYTCCEDVDSNLVACEFDGPGEYDGHEICFRPTEDGTYRFILTARDRCGEYDSDTAWITVEFNVPPTISFGDDTTISLPSAQQICLNYTVYEPNSNGAIERLISPFGTIYPGSNQVCFTPTSSGLYRIIVRIIDQCERDDYDTIDVTVNLGSTIAGDENTLPEGFALHQNFPNPFNPSTEISFALAEATYVELGVYNVVGQQVALLVNGVREAGEHTVVWHGDLHPSGVYFYRLRAGDVIETRKMILLK
jgi:hypothetical protein